MASLIKQFSGRKRGSCVWKYEKLDKSTCIHKIRGPRLQSAYELGVVLINIKLS